MGEAREKVTKGGEVDKKAMVMVLTVVAVPTEQQEESWENKGGEEEKAISALLVGSITTGKKGRGILPSDRKRGTIQRFCED